MQLELLRTEGIEQKSSLRMTDVRNLDSIVQVKGGSGGDGDWSHTECSTETLKSNLLKKQSKICGRSYRVCVCVCVVVSVCVFV